MSPIVPIAIGGVSLAALALALRGKTPPSTEGPVYMKGAAGTRQYEVKRVGPGYAWYISGDKVESGSDTVSGTALTTMFERLFTSNTTQVVTGQVAKGSEPGMAGSFTVHKEGSIWGWLVSKPSPDQATALGTGDSTSRGAATLAALGAIAPYTDWIVGVPSPVGAGAPGQASLVDFEQRNGLIITSSSVSAFDLPTWLAHAGPIIAGAMPAPEHQGSNGGVAAHMLSLLFGFEDPKAYKYTSKSYAQVLANMTATLDSWEQDKYLSIASVEYTLAAQAIGAIIPTVGKIGRVKGRPVVVRHYQGGYEWLVWPAGNRTADANAIATGEAKTLFKAWQEAVKAASSGLQGGGGIVGPGQVDQPGKAPCVSLKTSALSRNIPAATMLARQEKDVKIWTPPTANCNRFTLSIGVCLTPHGGGTFGMLDFYTEGQTQDGPLAKAEQDDVTFMLERHDGSQVDWFLFRKPLAWKRQYQVDVSYEDGVIDIISTKRVDMPEVDACPDRSRRWPGLGDDHYKIGVWGGGLGVEEIHTKNWTSQPELSLRVDGKSLIANVKVYGLPSFDTGHHPSQNRVFAVRQPEKKTSYAIGFKIRSEGKQA